MTARVTASERDLRTLAGIVSDHRADLPAEGLPLSLLADLKDQIRCDKVQVAGLDSAAPLKPLPKPVDLGRYRIRRQTRIGCLINEYRLVA